MRPVVLDAMELTCEPLEPLPLEPLVVCGKGEEWGLLNVLYIAMW